MAYEINEKLLGLSPYDPVTAADVIRLDANESYISPPQNILEKAFSRAKSLAFNRYPDPAAGELCAAFAKRYGVPTQCVAAGNGSDELISLLFLAFLQKGEAFAVLEPDFSMYAFNGYLNEARQVSIPKKNFRVDVDAVIETCRRERARLLIFSNPCNPTGIVLPREEVRRLVDGVEGLVILDEAYMDFSDQSLLDEVSRHDNLIILRTCSKAVGLAALRLGFAVANEKLVGLIKAAKAPYNVNALSQAVGTVLLEEKAFLDQARTELLTSRKYLVSHLKETQSHFPGRFLMLDTGANFVSLVMPDAEKACKWLFENKIAVRYTGGLLRITCGLPMENAALLQRFAEYLAQG